MIRAVRFRTVVADPPWRYRNRSTGGTHRSGAAQQYRTMTTEEVKRLPVPSIVAADALLFLWVTVPILNETLGVVEAWGFRYKTALFWDKERLGMGFWFRGQVELCLVGVRGHPRPFGSQSRNIIRERSKQHSRKPDRFWEMIDPVAPSPRVELFAREERPGWERWGDEVQSTVHLPTEVVR